MKRIVLFLTLVTANVIFAQTPTLPSGLGTSDKPYQIANLENLYWIADKTNNNSVNFSGIYFVQTADIDASGASTWTDQNGFNSGWTTIGSYESPFAGSYDGNGHTIDKLSMNTTAYLVVFQEQQLKISVLHRSTSTLAQVLVSEE